MKIIALLGLFLVTTASAEILVSGEVRSGAGYSYGHPALPSLVFASPEYRQMAILPPSPVFIVPPPLLMRSPGMMPAYPPLAPYAGGYSPQHPANRDGSAYSMQRAHAFSQNLYRKDAGPYFWSGSIGFGWGVYDNLYAPVGAVGFNQPPRPSNRDNTTYNLERAHRFGMDSYRKP